MRLVSQNGNVDIPYEKTTLLYAQDYVMARIDNKEYVMGEYSSMEKSYNVMKMARNKWAKIKFFETVYNKGFLNELTEQVGLEEATESVHSVFQFPKDEEVEV